MKVKIVNDILQKFPDLTILIAEVKDVKVYELDPKLEEFKKEVFAKVMSRFNLEGLKDEPVFRAYRDFFWRIGVDPT